MGYSRDVYSYAVGKREEAQAHFLRKIEGPKVSCSYKAFGTVLGYNFPPVTDKDKSTSNHFVLQVYASIIGFGMLIPARGNLAFVFS